MDKQFKPTKDSKGSSAGKQKNRPARPERSETEFAEELTRSDIESAFKNPITGEERMY